MDLFMAYKCLVSSDSMPSSCPISGSAVLDINLGWLGHVEIRISDSHVCVNSLFNRNTHYVLSCKKKYYQWFLVC